MFYTIPGKWMLTTCDAQAVLVAFISPHSLHRYFPQPPGDFFNISIEKVLTPSGLTFRSLKLAAQRRPHFSGIQTLVSRSRKRDLIKIVLSFLYLNNGRLSLRCQADQASWLLRVWVGRPSLGTSITIPIRITPHRALHLQFLKKGLQVHLLHGNLSIRDKLEHSLHINRIDALKVDQGVGVRILLQYLLEQ